MQAKESKHAGLKKELSLTNRSTKASSSGKWWQIMRSNYVRSFYLPEHQPSPPTYYSHFKARVPLHCVDHPYFCNCGRGKVPSSLSCTVCSESILVLDCAMQQKLLPAVVAILKPHNCSECDKCFADKNSLDAHAVIHRSARSTQKVNETLVPKSMSVEQLKAALRERGLSTSGRKDMLVMRLEGVLSVS